MLFSCFPAVALLAIAIHGAGHILAAATVGMRFGRLRLTATGLRLLSDQPYPSYRAEALVALGGPLFNLVSAALVYAHLQGCDFVLLSLYLGLLNLLPLRGFDGGTLLLCFLCDRHALFPSLSPRTAERIISAISALVLMLLWLAAVYLLLRRESALSLYVFCLQLFRSVFVEARERFDANF